MFAPLYLEKPICWGVCWNKEREIITAKITNRIIVINIIINIKKKSKAIPVTDRGGL
jgi:hypothetical protein